MKFPLGGYQSVDVNGCIRPSKMTAMANLVCGRRPLAKRISFLASLRSDRFRALHHMDRCAMFLDNSLGKSCPLNAKHIARSLGNPKRVP